MALATTHEVLEQSKQKYCGCVTCRLAEQEDFKEQSSALEEIAEARSSAQFKHNCIFLPKFHPELNPIERVWSRMKWYVRKYCNNKSNLEELLKRMVEGLGSVNLPLNLVRKYIRTTLCYLIAYRNGHDIVTATTVIKKYKSHRAYNKSTDMSTVTIFGDLQQLYGIAEENNNNDIDDDNDENSNVENDATIEAIPDEETTPVEPFQIEDVLDSVDDDVAKLTSFYNSICIQE